MLGYTLSSQLQCYLPLCDSTFYHGRSKMMRAAFKNKVLTGNEFRVPCNSRSRFCGSTCTQYMLIRFFQLLGYLPFAKTVSIFFQRTAHRFYCSTIFVAKSID